MYLFREAQLDRIVLVVLLQDMSRYLALVWSNFSAYFKKRRIKFWMKRKGIYKNCDQRIAFLEVA